MRKFILAAAMAATLPIFVAPAQADVSLSANDPKFDSRACVAARERQMKYGQSAESKKHLAAGLFFLLATSPFYPPGTYDPTAEEKSIDADLKRSCITRVSEHRVRHRRMRHHRSK